MTRESLVGERGRPEERGTAVREEVRAGVRNALEAGRVRPRGNGSVT